MKKGYVDTPEGQIHYRTDGRGQDLLLLHQAPMSSEEYEGMIPFLAPHCHVVAPDMPGHGNSDDPPREYEIADYARAIQGFLRALKIGKTAVFGHHTGSVVAVEMAIAFPSVVSSLAISGCPVWSEEERKKHLAGMKPRGGMVVDAEGETVKQAWGVYRSLSGHPDPQQYLGPFLVGFASRKRPYDAHAAVYRYPMASRLPLIKQRTLLVSGTRDMFHKDLESTARLIPGAKTAAVPNAGIFGAREEPEAFARLILQFLKEGTR